MTSLLLLCMVSACVNPLPVGPGRVKVTQEQVQLIAVPGRLLFQKYGYSETDADKTWEAVRFGFTSNVDLHEYFRGKMIQFRCRVEGAGAKYTAHGTGPYYEDTHLENLPPTTRLEKTAAGYQYSAFGFVDLTAERADDSETSLEQLRFSRLSCFVIGVNKAPVLFPRSNDLVMSYEDFVTQLQGLRARSE